jgi:hypothetical protein
VANLGKAQAVTATAEPVQLRRQPGVYAVDQPGRQRIPDCDADLAAETVTRADPAGVLPPVPAARPAGVQSPHSLPNPDTTEWPRTRSATFGPQVTAPICSHHAQPATEPEQTNQCRTSSLASIDSALG